MLFSERYGFQKVRDALQYDTMDAALRNSLWNVVDLFVWNSVDRHAIEHGLASSDDPRIVEVNNLCVGLWLKYYKRPLDEMGVRWQERHERIRQEFFECDWHRVYDFVEFVAKHYKRPGFQKNFIEACNRVLEDERSAFRFLGDQVVRITAAEELDEIEKAMAGASDAVLAHLKRSVEMLASQETPDYRNSIKESILAVEAMVIEVVGKKGTLGQLLKNLGGKGIHPAMSGAFEKLYGFTSDTGGIRHALTAGEPVDFHDAKFFLIACSAFVNFVRGKSAKVAGESALE